jgi:uncharacterized RDD family membrane protein YckC
MYKYKRILAYLIDVTLMLLTVAFSLNIELNQLAIYFAQGFVGFSAPSTESIILTIIIPIILFGITTGLLGKTPGKMLMKLRVVRLDNQPTGIKNGIIRETIKCAAFTCLILGLAWALYDLFTTGRTFYDDWLRLSVEDESDREEDNLTETQKAWRESNRE